MSGEQHAGPMVHISLVRRVDRKSFSLNSASMAASTSMSEIGDRGPEAVALLLGFRFPPVDFSTWHIDNEMGRRIVVIVDGGKLSVALERVIPNAGTTEQDPPSIKGPRSGCIVAADRAQNAGKLKKIKGGGKGGGVEGESGFVY